MGHQVFYVLSATLDEVFYILNATLDEVFYILNATLDEVFYILNATFQVALSKLHCSHFIEDGSSFCAQDVDCRLDMSYQKFACVPCGWLNWYQREAYGTLDPVLNPGSRHQRMDRGRWYTAVLADSIANKNPKIEAIHLSPVELLT
jgi:hypothetical protein